MATHIRKRPFQPSITSYFDRGDTTHRERSSRSPLSPPLPAETQASLLSVGMRVRKSVPEGYKTHKTLGTNAYQLPPSTSPALSTASARAPLGSGSARISRELAPFCGLHKTGGLEVQDQGWVPASSAPSALQTGDGGYGGVPGLSWSQSTLASGQSSFSTFMVPNDGGGKKRSYEEETEDDLDAFFDDEDAAETDHTMRVIARPKGSVRRATTGATFGAGDFDDAVFLAPMDVDDG